MVEVPGAPAVRVALGQDALLALGVALLLVLGSEFAVEDDLWSEWPRVVGPLLPGPGAGSLLLAGSLPLALRRIAPLTVLAVCTTAALAEQALGTPPPLPLGVLVAVYTVAVRHRPLVGVAAAVACAAAATAGIATGWARISDDVFYVHAVSLMATVGLAYGVALSRARAGLAEQRAVSLAREQEARTRAAVAQEQARIAREVHDIVAHDVSVVVAQAAAARRTLPPDSAAVNTLQAIETVGRDALDGLRRLVHLLRADADADAGDRSRAPLPGLDGLPLLLAQVRRAGLPVDLEVRGTARPLPGTVETNAYRIVQEALTNTLKHAGRTRATVVLDYGEDRLEVEIRDQGRPSPVPAPAVAGDDVAPGPARGGFGMVSMQQRADLLGGELTAGPRAEGGFRVAARLPLHGG